MNVAFGGIARNDSEDEFLGQVDSEDFRVVVGEAMHRLGVHFDVVEPGYGNAFEETFDVTVAALPRVGVRLFVEAEVFEIEG